MGESITCPQCKLIQARGAKCSSCGMDFTRLAPQEGSRRAQQPSARTVQCPYCKTSQPLSNHCRKCSLDFRAYAEYSRRRKAGENVKPPRPPARSPKQTSNADTTKPLELEDLFKQTWETFKRRWITLVTLNLLYLAAILVAILPFAITLAQVSNDADPATLVPLVAGLILAVIMVSFAAMSMVFAGTTNENLSLGESISTGIRKAPALVWVMFLQSLIITGGFLLFAVPGFVFMVWFVFAPYMVFAEDARGMDALIKSKEYVRGHGWDVFLKLIVIFVIYMVVGSIPIAGPLLGIPFMLLFIVHMYRDMVRVKGPNMPWPTDTWSRLKWPLVGLAGVTAPVALIIVLALPFVGALQNMETGIKADIFSDHQTAEETARTQLNLNKVSYSPDEPIIVTYSGMPGNAQDWITVVGAMAPKDSYGEYFYTEGQTDGDMNFGGLQPGRYEARAYHDWPNGGYEIMSRTPFTVEPPSNAPRLMLDRDVFFPGESISVRFIVPEDFSTYGWAGIVRSALPHGNERLNRQNTSIFELLGKHTSGQLSFRAPSRAGEYDIRLHDKQDGNEVFHASFSVVNNSSPSTVSIRATSDDPVKAFVKIHGLNCEASVGVNEKPIYKIPGGPDEKNKPHNYEGSILLMAGSNDFKVKHKALPGAEDALIRLSIYTTDPATGKRKLLARWNINAPYGESVFTIKVEGAGIKA